MARTTCPACGANVDMAEDVNTHEAVPLEINTEGPGQAARYRVVNQGQPTLVERVPDNWPEEFFPDHRFDCPGFNAGRTI